MKARWIGGLAALLAAASFTAARADEKTDRKAIDELYAKISRAMKNKDVKGIMAVGTPDFTMIQHGQPPMNGKQVATQMEMEFKQMKSVEVCSMKPSKVELKGNTAVVTSDGLFSGTLVGADKKLHKFGDKSVAKDTLVKTPQGWKFKSVEIVKDSMTMDGKPFDPAAMSATSKPAGAPGKGK